MKETRHRLNIAYRYAQRLSNLWYKDIVHSAYLNWLEKGKDLLIEPIYRMLRVIKLTFFNMDYDKRGRYQTRHFEQYEESISQEVPQDEILDAKLRLEHIVNRTSERFYKSSANMLQAVNLLSQGYTKKEASIEMGITKSNISYYINNLRQA